MPVNKWNLIAGVSGLIGLTAAGVRLLGVQHADADGVGLSGSATPVQRGCIEHGTGGIPLARAPRPIRSR